MRDKKVTLNGEAQPPSQKSMNTPKDSTGGCCPTPPCSADPGLEEISDKIRHGQPVGIMEALAAIEYQSARKVLPWCRKDALGWPIETLKGKPVKSAIRIICQNIRKVIFKPNDQGEAQPPSQKSMNTPKDSTGGCCPTPPCSAFREGMRVQRLSQHRIKGEVDYVREDGKVMVTWDICGRWLISPDDLRILPNENNPSTP